MIERYQRWLMFLAAVLFLIGALTGMAVSLAMTKAIPVDAGSILAAHLNALLGAFWMLGVAWTLPRWALTARSLSGPGVRTRRASLTIDCSQSRVSRFPQVERAPLVLERAPLM